MALDLSEKDLDNPEELGQKLITLAEIVVRKHFYASYNEQEDLVSVGVLKALSLIDGGKWAKGKGSFVNYIYSGMRNDMHNYLYHHNKEVSSNDAFNDDCTKDEYFEDETCYIDYRVIRLVCMDFEKSFGGGIEQLVLDEIKRLGFVVKGMDTKVHTLQVFNPEVQGRYGLEVKDEVVGRLVGIVLWKRKEYNI